MGKSHPRSRHRGSRFYLMNACIALVLHIFYWLAISDRLATSHQQNYNLEATEKFPRIAILCYHLIWMTWIIEKITWGVHQPNFLQVALGIVFFLPGMSLVAWAMRSNPYFMPNLAYPERIVRSGAYKFSRHPGYIGFVLMSGSLSLILGHSTGVFPLLAYWVMLGIRAKQENRLLYE